jgi:hypothetical protein
MNRAGEALERLLDAQDSWAFDLVCQLAGGLTVGYFAAHVVAAWALGRLPL